MAGFVASRISGNARSPLKEELGAHPNQSLSQYQLCLFGITIYN